MEVKTELILPVINASGEDWEEKSQWEELTAEAVASRSNFIVVFNPGGAGMDPLMRILDCPPSLLPQRLCRWSIYGLTEVLDPEDYSWLLSVSDARDIRIIEQLNLSVNSPPRSKNYLVYSEVHGIISDHDALEQAREIYAAYLARFGRARLYPLSGIYHWQSHEWCQVPQE